MCRCLRPEVCLTSAFLLLVFVRHNSRKKERSNQILRRGRCVRGE
jgi:hypothetical protein